MADQLREELESSKKSFRSKREYGWFLREMGRSALEMTKINR